MPIPTQTKPLNDAAVAAEIKAAYESNADTNEFSDSEKTKLALPLYERGNLLGTVSQAAGVPTGAVIERGSNANGEYVRWADGTQICTHKKNTAAALNISTGAVYTTGNTNWSFPAAFSDPPIVSVLELSGNGICWGGLGDNGTTTTSTSFSMFKSTVGSVSFVGLSAIGRWY
jgi:hypothetical protein